MVLELSIFMVQNNNSSSPSNMNNCSNGTVSESQDQISSFYIHGSENPSNAMVNPILMGNNYRS